MIIPLQKIKEEIKNSKLDAVLISSMPNIIYLTSFPGSTTDEREAFLLICKDQQYFVTDTRIGATVKNNVKDFQLAETKPYLSPQLILEKLAKKHKIKILGIEERNLTVSEYKMLRKLFKTKNFNTGNLRIIKTNEEISKIEKACKLGDRTFNYILKKIKLGISEKELANEIELFIKRQGANTSFATIVAFGKNSAIPHHVPSNRKLTPDNIVLMDFGVKLDNYCSDMTRTIFFGEASGEFKKMYRTVLEAQNLAIKNLKSLILNHKSISAKNIDKAARDYIISQGYPSIPHSLGHGVGLQIHESPRLSPKSKDILKKNMVFSIEPGIYLPDFGGIRIEDLAVLKKEGLTLLTKSPKNITII